MNKLTEETTQKFAYPATEEAAQQFRDAQISHKPTTKQEKLEMIGQIAECAYARAVCDGCGGICYGQDVDELSEGAYQEGWRVTNERLLCRKCRRKKEYK